VLGGRRFIDVDAKSKKLRPVKLPPEVIASLRDVHAMIVAGDELTAVYTDDGIQEGPLCGSLMDDGSGRFYFSVHLKDNSPYVWDIALTPAEIQAIAVGSLDEIPLWCCTNPNCGFKTYIKDITCHWCDYGGDGTPRR
jgi:hypothetical protein